MVMDLNSANGNLHALAVCPDMTSVDEGEVKPELWFQIDGQFVISIGILSAQ